MNLLKSETKTMSSTDFLELINEIRNQHGEKTIRLNDFNNRIKDELDDDHYETFVVKNPNNTESHVYNLTIEQCMLVGMRESKGVRRSVLKKLKSLENKEQFYIPQTYGDALQLCADQAKQLELQAPKVNFYDTLADRKNLMTASQIAQKIKMSAVILNRHLTEVDVYNGTVKRSKVFKQWFIDKELGEMKQTELGYSQALFTPKGEQWIFEKFTSEGII